MNSGVFHESETTQSHLPLVCGYVITYDGKKFLDRCFETLEELTDYENLELILVDNGSTDGSGDYVRENYPNVEVMRVFPNVGYSRGANEAVEDARRRGAKYIVLMNDDIAFRHPQWLREAVMHAEHDPRIGIIGMLESYSENGPQPAPESTLTDFEYLGSAVLVIPIVLFDRVGMFDEVYFIGGDESEMGVRAQAAGYRAVKLNIPVFHFGGGTMQNFSRRTAYLHMRNGIRFCLKNHGWRRAFLRAARMLDVACNPWPVAFDKNHVANSRMRNSGGLGINFVTWLRAVVWNIVHLPQTLHIRAAERQLIRAARAARNESTVSVHNRAPIQRRLDNSLLEPAQTGDRT
jgi:GT2 family glycosyltransferase